MTCVIRYYQMSLMSMTLGLYDRTADNRGDTADWNQQTAGLIGNARSEQSSAILTQWQSPNFLQ